MARYLPENKVLKPKDPAIKDNNDWELFTISNAEVRDSKTGELCSLLMADQMQPLTVTGNLVQLKRKQTSLLLRPEYSKSTPIRVDDVMVFSYGNDPDDDEDPDGVQVWAAGEAGWFKIKPGRPYKNIFQEMQESIELLWFAGDVYENHKKGGGGPPAEQVFREYAEDEDTTCSTIQEARARFYKHRLFLLLAMINGKESIAWGHNPLRNHLKHQFPDDFQTMQNKATQKQSEKDKEKEVEVEMEKSSKPTRTGSGSQPKDDVVMVEDPLAHARKSTAKSAVSKTEPFRPKKDENWFKARVVWELIQRSEADGALSANVMAIDNIARAMTRRYDIDDLDLAANHIRSLHLNLRYMMEKKTARKASGTNWTKTALYKSLKSPTMLVATLRKAQDVELRVRRTPLPEPADSESENEAHDRKRRRGKTGRLSVLRPTGSKFSGKAASRKGKGPKTVSHPVSDESDVGSEPYDQHSPSRMKSSSSGLLNNDEQPPPELPMTPLNDEDGSARAFSDEDDDIESPMSSTISSPANITSTTTLPSIWPDTEAGAMLTAGLRSQPQESYVANQPGDVWLCPHLGCNQKFFGASSAPSRLLMHQHYITHSNRGTRDTARTTDVTGDEVGVDRERLDLVMNEEQRSRLPVGNLIQRIRELARAQGVGTPGASALDDLLNGNGFPEPIQQKI